jgi:hypothetical protein
VPRFTPTFGSFLLSVRRSPGRLTFALSRYHCRRNPCPRNQPFQSRKLPLCMPAGVSSAACGQTSISRLRTLARTFHRLRLRADQPIQQSGGSFARLSRFRRRLLAFGGNLYLR